MLTASRIQQFDDERFYSLVDVALDIKGELDFGEEPVSIPVFRTVVRYGVLCPARTPGVLARYCELRRKASAFFEREGYVADVRSTDQMLEDFEAELEMSVPDVAQFNALVVLLEKEEKRRQSISSEADLPRAMGQVGQLADRFHRVALRLARRRDKRSTLIINDEYDVQDLFGALLETRFSDIRAEEWAPSHAGKPARVDFLLKEASVMVEIKMTRDGLSDGKLGDELSIDITHYKKHPDCKALFCFVYDPDHRLKNPDGLEADLSRKADGLIVRVQVWPRR